MIHKILTLFINTLTIDEKRFLLTKDNLTQAIQIQLSQKQKPFFEFLITFSKSILNFEHSRKKLTLVDDVFLEIPAQTNIVR